MTPHRDDLDHSALHEQVAKDDAVCWANDTNTVGVDERTYGMIQVDFSMRFDEGWMSANNKPDFSSYYVSSSDISTDCELDSAAEARF